MQALLKLKELKKACFYVMIMEKKIDELIKALLAGKRI